MNAKLASLAAVTMLLPFDAVAETVALTCTLERLDKNGASLGTQPLSLAYEGDTSTGVLAVHSPWGEIMILTAEYILFSNGDYKIDGDGPATIIMPDVVELTECLKWKGRVGDLRYRDLFLHFVEQCRVEVPDGKEPVAANVEMTVSIVGGEPDVYIVRTYEEESEISGHHIDIVSLPQPKCVVTK